jgi:hypothetical protein
MIKTTTIAYAFLLLIAFVVGLCGTLAASRAVMREWDPRSGGIDRPASAPARPTPVRRWQGVEC